MPSPEEQEWHAAQKEKIKGKRDFDLQARLGLEGVEEGLLISVTIAIEAIIALLLAPEPAISKVAAGIASVVVGFFVVIAVAVILISSKSEIKAIWDTFQAAEKAEDERHAQAVRGG
jgi:hypothetical protein